MLGIKYALVHLVSEWKRNLLKIIFYALIFYLLFAMTLMSMASGRQIDSVRQNLGNSVQILKKAIDGDVRDKISDFTSEEIEILSSYYGVLSYNALSNGYGNIENISAYIGAKSKEEYEKFLKEKGNPDQFMFIGVTDSKRAPMFAGAGYELIHGQHLEPDDLDMVLISDKLARENNLSVGSEVTLETGRIYMRGADPVQVTVKGIFRCPSGIGAENYQYVPYWQAENQIFVVQTTLQNMNELNYAINQVFVYLQGDFSFDQYVLAMKEALGETVYDDAYFCNVTYVYNRNETAYERVVLPLEQIHDSVLVMAVIIGIGCYIVFLLVCSWFLKGKRRQIGICVSMGMSKVQIFSQLLAEEFVTMAVAGLLAILLLTGTVRQISGFMIQNSAASVNEQMEDIRMLRNIETKGNDSYIMSYDLSDGELNYFQAPETIHAYEVLREFWIYALTGILLAGCTVVGQAARILKESPSKLLR